MKFFKKPCMLQDQIKHYTFIINQTCCCSATSSSREDQTIRNGFLTSDSNVQLVKSTTSHSPDGKHRRDIWVTLLLEFKRHRMVGVGTVPQYKIQPFGSDCWHKVFIFANHLNLGSALLQGMSTVLFWRAAFQITPAA